MFGRIYSKIRDSKRNAYINSLIQKGMVVGKNVSFVDTCFLDSAHCFLITIEDNCTFAPSVTILAHDASTKIHLGYTKLGKVTIKENTFIGHSAMIMPGVTIGRNVIVAAGSIVTKDVPDGVVVAGNPAKFLITVDEYLAKIRADVEGGDKVVFGREYFIDQITNEKKLELIEAATNDTAYIK